MGGAEVSALVGRRYQLFEQIGSGGMGAVYRALDRLNGRRVALKRVSARPEPSAPGDSTDQRLSLAREFQILTSLRHPHILSVLDYGFDEERQPFLVSEYQEHALNLLEAARGAELTAQVELLVQVLQALAYLHRRKVIHCDLKPANILVVGGSVRVLDFGLSVVGEGEPSVSGTPAYLAPEVLRGAPPTLASDLYAVGVMAYELLAGRHPFDTSSRAALLRGVLGRAPDLSALQGGPGLAAVVGKLLAKDPSERYGHATDVIAALSAAVERPLAAETAATRESFLQAAQLVGRQREVEQFEAELRRVLRGQGSAWLVGGESGVGKSRLLGEVRTRALVHGALVLSGQAESEAGGPHRLWREVLRWLSLLVEPSDFEASVLKPLVPDIASLLGRPVPDPPEIDLAAIHARLLEVVSGLLHRLRQPVVILLEDLQWAQSESLRLLGSLVPLASTLPLLLIGTWRDEERPHLPAELGGAQVLRLGRLSAEAMAELGESMMGAAGRRPEVGALLARETEGNTFFLVEVVRALAEEAGGLEQVGSRPLPERIFTGGVQRAVERRLGRVPEPAQPLLRLCAVLGRVLPLEVLQALAPGEQLGQWLLTCSEAAVLEPWEQSWRFAHDKLREGLLAQLEPELRRSLHRRAAEVLEQVTPEQPAALAFHWSAAGEDSREALWSLRAAEQAFRSGAYPEARALLERVAVLQEQLGAPRVERAATQRKLGEIALQLNELPTASRHLLAVPELLGQPLPSSALGWGLFTLRHLLTQLAQLPWPGLFLERGEQRRRELLEVAQAFYPLVKLHAAQGGSPLKVIGLILGSAVLADRAGQPYTVALASLGIIAGAGGLHGLARLYFQRARGGPGALRGADLAVLVYAESSHLLHQGQLSKAMAHIEQGYAAAEGMGDRNSAALLRHVQVECEYFSGRYESMLQHERQVRERLGNTVISFVATEALALCMLGRPEEAQACLEGGTPYEGQGQPLPDALALAIKSQVLRQRGEQEAALEAAVAALQRLGSKRELLTPLAWGIQGELLLGAILEALLGAWSRAAHAGAQAEVARLEALALRALSLARYWSRRQRIGLPRVLIYQGRAELLQGRERGALRSWLRALRLAEQLSLPLPQALAGLELGRHRLVAPAERTALLERARGLLAACDAAHLLETGP